jgi:hypothetical protein
MVFSEGKMPSRAAPEVDRGVSSSRQQSAWRAMKLQNRRATCQISGSACPWQNGGIQVKQREY